MKYLSVFLLICSINVLSYAEGPIWYKPGNALYVAAQSGLNLRAAADIGGSLVIKVPYGGKLKVLADTAKPVVFKFDNIDGHWVYADYNGKKGYIFDGYLTSLKPPKLTGETPGFFVDYLITLFDDPADPEITEEGGEGQMTVISTYKFDNGITAEVSVTDYWTDDPDYIREVYFFPKMQRIEEVFLLLKALGYFSGDPKFLFPEAGMTPKQNKLGLTITKYSGNLIMSKDGLYIYISIDKAGVTLDIRNQ